MKRFFKVYLFLTAFLAPAFLNVQAQWIVQPSPVIKKLTKCVFTDSLNGWASGDSGVIIHTSNGGQLWQVQDSHIDYEIEDIFFVNNFTGWAVANKFLYEGTTILKTTNGGNNWNASHYPDTTIVLNTVYFNDSLNGWLAGFEAVILKTSDGGNTWMHSPVDSGYLAYLRVKKFDFYNTAYGFGVGGQMDVAGLIWRTSNYGVSWQSAVVSPEPIYDIHFFDSLNAIGTGGDFEYGASIVRTTNGGNNWVYTSLELFGQGNAVAFRTINEGWISLIYTTELAYSTDGGANWAVQPAPNNKMVWDIKFFNAKNGWLVGDSGLVAKYDTSFTGIYNQPGTVSQFTLSQNYPNPFNPSTVIAYYLAKAQKVSLKIYSVDGAEIKSYDLGFNYIGEHSFLFDGTGLAAGIYYYSLQAGSFRKTKKMVLLK